MFATNLESASSNVVQLRRTCRRGRHRAYVTDFIRDAKGGGCTAGIPTTNLRLQTRGERHALSLDARLMAGATAPHRSLAQGEVRADPPVDQSQSRPQRSVDIVTSQR